MIGSRVARPRIGGSWTCRKDLEGGRGRQPYEESRQGEAQLDRAPQQEGGGTQEHLH